MSEEKGKFELDYLDAYVIKNPEALGLSEKKLWRRIEPILDELLEELKGNGKIETSFSKSEVKHVDNILDNLNMISTNNNLLLHACDTADKAQRFVKVLAEFGFTDPSVFHLYVEVAALLLIQNFECFKMLLLSLLRDVDFRVFRFGDTMEKSAPTSWQKLKPELDNRFRNAFSHGLWTIENKRIVLFEDAKLIPFEKLDLAHFMIEVKTQNVLFACLINVIHKKGKQGFFAC